MLTKVPDSKSYDFSSGHLWMWELDHKEGWALKYYAFEMWCWRRLLRVPWTARRSNQSILKGSILNIQGRTGAEADIPIIWPPDMKSWLIGKDRVAGKDWKQEQKGTTEDKMVGWHHWLERHEFEQALGDGEGQGSLACSVHGAAKSHTGLSGRTTILFYTNSLVIEITICQTTLNTNKFIIKS